MRSRGDDFKPIRAESGLSAKAACHYTRRPEVTAAPPSRRRQNLTVTTSDDRLVGLITLRDAEEALRELEG